MTTITKNSTRFKHARLVLAREKDHPVGDNNQGYDLLLPLDKNGHIDAREWKVTQDKCRVRHFRPGQDDLIGRLRRKPGGQWYVDYTIGETDDELIFRLSDERFAIGEYISIKSAGVMHTYRVITIETP
ncbi:hypothetical protein [Phyllobacterium sp. P30BS-XVII]|uniref:hypothetical protein n=1 Tax=Phyllobacterium sp. P30BS-XVII TaxID=2587046 RepID=UPI000DE088CC|nr:hypothetical protein [Phyllobacterium sp. P30BS-XVII]MBA8903143.1 hypothetical protein [Phyllobacterium sp. P30BS-XVII]